MYTQRGMNRANWRHGESEGDKESAEYKAYYHMLGRCYNPNDTKYKIYGGRGIVVCNRWLHSFFNFLTDMNRKPTPKHTLGRIDNDGNYTPRNCAWQLPVTQARNRRSNKLTIEDVREIRRLASYHTLRKLAEMFNVSYSTIAKISDGTNWKE